MPTREKEKQIAVLKDRLEQAKTIIIADHTGINVADLTMLRRNLKQANAEFRVAKNTLLRLATRELDVAGIEKYFIGPTSMIFGFDDPSVPAGIVYEFMKKADIPKIKAYFLNNKLLPFEDFKRIAQLPPRDVVLAMVVGAAIGPISNFIMTLEGVVRNFIGLLDALAESEK